MKNLEKSYRFNVELVYKDESNFSFDVELEGNLNKVTAVISMITRGTLMASNAVRAIAYNNDGFDVCNYIK